MFDTLAPMLHALKELADRHRPVAMAGERTLPVIDALRPLLPGGGLRRGATVGVTGSTAVLLALLAGPSAAGSWCAAVCMPWLGAAAAAELGVALERLALIPHAGREWAATVAALLDGFDVVAASVPLNLHQGDARRLAARARERGAVLVAVGEGWPALDVRVRAGPSRWVGLGHGHGHLESRFVPVAVEGRGAAARPRHGRLWLPGPDHGVVPAPAVKEGVVSAGAASAAGGVGGLGGLGGAGRPPRPQRRPASAGAVAAGAAAAAAGVSA